MSATISKKNLGISSPETDYSLHSLWLEIKSGKYLRTDMWDTKEKKISAKDNELGES